MLSSSCEEMQQGATDGKADGWWCTAWTWWLCSGSGSGGGSADTLRLRGSLNGPRALAQDDYALYYVLDDKTNGQVVRYSKSGGTTKTLAQMQAGPRRLVVDETHVYWINYGDGFDVHSSLMRVARTGGAPELLASDGPDLLDLAIDANDVYVSGDGGVYRLPKSGGSMELLSDLGVASYKSAPSLALDEDAIYVIDSWSDPQLHRVEKADGMRTVLVTNPGVSALAVDGQHVYWNAGEAGVQRVSKWGGAVESLGGASKAGSDGLVLASEWIYFTDRMGDRVARVPLGGGAEEELASDQDGPMGLVVDGDTVYFTNEGTYSASDYNRDGELMKLTLP